MKKIVNMLGIAILTATMASINCPVAYAQEKETTKQEVKAAKKQARENKKDLYTKSDKMVRKEAKRLKKEGWKTMNMPIEKQLQQTWERQWSSDPDGYPKYIVKEGLAVGKSYSAAQMQAENVAKVRIASDIGSSVASLAEVALANQEISPNDAASLNKVVENSKILVAEKLGRVFTSQNLYRMKNNDSAYEVRVVVMYDMRQAIELAHQVMVQQIENHLEELSLQNKAAIESLISPEEIATAYLANDYDETI